jgi:hypothetical protein
MKLLILSLLLAVPGGAAQAALSWKSEAEKRIYYAQTPRLALSLEELEATENAWDVLNVSLKYETGDAQAEVNELKKANPGYAVTRALLSRNGSYRLEIPVLGKDEVIEPQAGMEGPYFSRRYFVPKKDSARVRAAVANLESFVRLSGGLKATVPMEQVVETVTLPGSICQDLTAKGRDIYHIALAFPAVDAKIREIAKEETNREILRDKVLHQCVELRSSEYVYDFAELLGLEVEEPSADQSFTAELKRAVQQEVPIPLQYRTVREN